MSLNAKLTQSVKNILNKYYNEFENSSDSSIGLRLVEDKPKTTTTTKKIKQDSPKTKLEAYEFKELKSIEVPNIEYYIKKNMKQSIDNLPKTITYNHPKDIKKIYKNIKFVDNIALDLSNVIYKLSNILVHNLLKHFNKKVLNDKFEHKGEKQEKNIDVVTIREDIMLELIRNSNGENPIIWNRIEQVMKKEITKYNTDITEYKKNQELKSKLKKDKKKVEQLMKKEAKKNGEEYQKKKEKREAKQIGPKFDDFIIIGKKDNTELSDQIYKYNSIKTKFNRLSTAIGFLERFKERWNELKDTQGADSKSVFNSVLFDKKEDGKCLYNELIYKDMSTFGVESSILNEEDKKLLLKIIALFKVKYDADKKIKQLNKVKEILDKYAEFKRLEKTFVPTKTKNGKDKKFTYPTIKITDTFFDFMKGLTENDIDAFVQLTELIEIIEADKNFEYKFIRKENKNKVSKEKNYELSIDMMSILKGFANQLTHLSEINIGQMKINIKISNNVFIMLNNIMNVLLFIILENITTGLELEKNKTLIVNDKIFRFSINSFFKDLNIRSDILELPDYYNQMVFIK